MSNYLDDYVSVQDRLKEFINAFPDYRIKTHVLEESLTSACDVYIVKCELFRTEADAAAWTTGLSSESKSKQYSLELAETGALGRALNLAGYFAKPSSAPRKPIQTTKPELAEFVKEQRPNDPEPIVWDVSDMAKEFGAEIIDEIPLCAQGCGPMILKQGTKEGKEYRGWVCPVPKSGHQAKWMKIGSDGKWAFQR
ncbi:MAG: hypothetical protein EBW87_01540 [Burkholderiaceae bacterium]|nr:hypothetical protein [Burkholderiaceae bacterium]